MNPTWPITLVARKSTSSMVRTNQLQPSQRGTETKYYVPPVYLVMINLNDLGRAVTGYKSIEYRLWKVVET
ncbi:unnamed protein product [Dovyalis caffra]|uniref:Uncharacterized protein n=1 Tax=Dovyalis caffra TaxID=77055 RepID=A0AAV1R3X2_9ROSI|nr:unnamed protein product [Dovyalis caffra]